MGVEIERKFLASSAAWRACVRATESLRQGYLTSGSSPSVRIRIADGRSALLTI